MQQDYKFLQTKYFIIHQMFSFYVNFKKTPDYMYYTPTN